MDTNFCTLEKNDDGERGIRAKRELYPGDRCIMESSLVWALASEHRKSRCHYCCCLREENTTIECARCGSLFCDERCAHLARHNEECSILASLGDDCSETVFAVARLCYTNSAKDLEGRGIHFKTHDNSLSAETRSQYDDMANGLSKLLQSLGYGHVTADQVFYWTVALSTNAIALVDHEPSPDNNNMNFLDKNGQLNGVVLGLALCTNLAMLNHSCDPSAAVSLDLRCGCAPILSCRTIKPLQYGQQLTLSYLPFAGLASTKRINILKNTYYFHCQCPLCINQQNQNLDSSESALNQAKVQVDACYQALLNFDSTHENLDLIFNSTQQSLAHLANHHYLQIQFLIALITYRVQNKNHPECFRLTQRLVSALSMHNPYTLLIHPINYARILCIGAAAAPNDAPATWLYTAIDIFHAHLGGFSSQLARNARELLLGSNAT